MGLVVIVDASKGRVVHVGEGTPLGLKVVPQWLQKAMTANPATYRTLNTDHYAGKDEGAQALFWLVEDLYESVRALTRQVCDLTADRDVYGMVPRETMGGG